MAGPDLLATDLLPVWYTQSSDEGGAIPTRRHGFRQSVRQSVGWFVVLAVVTLGVSSSALGATAQQERLNQLTSQQSQLRKQILEKQKLAETAKKEVQKLTKEVDRLERDITVTERKITETEGAIVATQNDIESKQQAISETERELLQQEDYQDEAIRVLYETGDDDPVRTMLETTSISDIVSQNQYLTALEERIQLIIDQVTATKHALEGQKADLEAREAELDRLKAQQEAYKIGLATQQQRKSLMKADQQAKQASLEEQVAEAKQLVNKVESEMSSLRSTLTRGTGRGTIQAKDRGTSTVGFQWPTDYSYISTYYGGSTPFQPNGGHGGLDLVNVSGTPVYAAADGTITAVASMTNNGRFYAYGQYIVVGHNARFSSLYAHLQSFAVSPGDEVKRGDVIGYMGSTGWSTGPHLHFEIWEYSSRANPLQFLP